MTVQEAKKAYLGFAAARGMNVTFSNITYTTSAWNASEWTLQPTSTLPRCTRSPALHLHRQQLRAGLQGQCRRTAKVYANGKLVDKNLAVKVVRL